MFPQNTARLFLREITRADIDPILAFASDPENTRHMIWGPATRRSVRAFVRRTETERRLTPRARWSIALVERSSLELIGICYIERLPSDQTTVQMGCMIRKQNWRQGFADEVTDERIRFVFEDLDAHQLIATSSPKNTGSIHNLQKHGLRLQGLVPDAVAHRGQTRDSLLFARANPAWQASARTTPIAV
jgi:[ribosomal protein S5]-alanine N-acetyltransferase